eukprot:3816465-Rhodomonas_salina.1
MRVLSDVGTDLAFAAIALRACYAMSGTDLAYGTTSWPPPCRLSLLCSHRSAPLSAYARPTRCPVLTLRKVLCNARTDRAYGATRCPVLTSAMVLPAVLGDRAQQPASLPRSGARGSTLRTPTPCPVLT